MFTNIKSKLVNRGYWEEAGEGGAGEGGVVDPIINEDKEKDAALAAKLEAEKAKKISDNEASLLKEVMTRKAKQQELEAKLKETENRLNMFSGIDLDEVKQLVEEKKTQAQKKLEEQGQWEQLKAQMKQENEKAVQSYADLVKQQEDRLQQQQQLIDKLTIGNSFASSQFIKEELNLSAEKAKTIYGTFFDILEDKVVPYNKPKGSADRVQLVGADGEPLSFEAALKKLIDADPDKDLLIKSKSKPGSASSSLGKRVEEKQPQLSGKDRIAAALSMAK
jgi:hypothetical protein